MKKIYMLLLCIIQFIQAQEIKLDTIFINTYKSTQLVFPEETVFDFVDIGTGDLHVSNKQIKNICIIQSIVDEPNFKNTNLFIKTKDNGVFNYIISYSEKPKKYTHYIFSDKQTNTSSIKTTLSENNKSVNNTNILVENIIKDKQDCFKPCTDYNTDAKCEFFGVYFFDKKIYYKIKISNQSFLDYTIKDYYCFAKNKKNRNTVDSERVIEPIKIFINSETIKGKTDEYIVIEFNQFSLNKKEEFFIEIKEGSNGQRDFKMTIPAYITNSPIIL